MIQPRTIGSLRMFAFVAGLSFSSLVIACPAGTGFKDLAADVPPVMSNSRELIQMSGEELFSDETTLKLAAAARRGDIRKVDELVENGADVNGRGTAGASPLFYALGSLSGFQRLLEHGADPNAVMGKGASVVHWAARMCDPGYLRAVLEHGAETEAVEPGFGFTPIFYASKEGIEHVRLLVDHGASLEARSARGYTPFLNAVLVYDYRSAHYLLERGANCRTTNDAGRDAVDLISKSWRTIRRGSEADAWRAQVISSLRTKGVHVPTVD